METTEQKSSCYNCIHRQVCGIFNSLWKSTDEIIDYSIVSPGIEYRLCETLAENCSQFENEGD